MNAKKLFFIFSASVVLLGLLMIFSVYVSKNMLAKKSQDLIAAKLDKDFTEEKERVYVKAQKDLDTYKDLESTLAKIIPKDKDQARAVRELYKISEESNVAISSIEFPASTLGVKKPAAKANNNASAASNTAKPSTNAGITQAEDIAGLPGVKGIEVTIEVGSTLESYEFTGYSNMIRFLEGVEKNRRNMQIKQVSVTPDEETGQVKFKVVLTIFVKP
jgi:hypothetical protein